MEANNCLIKNLKTKGCISDKNLKCFDYEFKSSSNLDKLYLLPKIPKRFFNVPGRPVMSNFDESTEKVSKVLDHHLKPIMHQGKCYIRDTENFLSKMRNFTSDGSFLVTTDVMGLCPSIPHSTGLNALISAPKNRKEKQIPSRELLKMTEFVLGNN